ncbi:hypothetical protein Scep_011272 [Stephania cephalantha]|uniref:F-box domain-containing protein n=1 Tax=Stephania cephalantha TaxID=152367 RepID=A0AAP0JCX4_9MAGN
MADEEEATMESTRAPSPIPDDIIFVMVLAMLPTKSLSRFKCVNKAWYGWITSPQFAKLHVQKQNSITTLTEDDLLLLTQPPPPWGNTLISLPLKWNYFDENHQEHPILQLDFLIKGLVVGPRILGSCNGLLLVKIICDDRRQLLYIWNPCTKDYMKLPNPPYFTSFVTHDSDYVQTIFGFGYDSTADDYKVLKLSTGLDIISCSYRTEGIIYTTRTNTWRSIPRIPHKIKFHEPGIFTVDGDINWIGTKDGDDQGYYYLVWFNIGSEEWREMLIEPSPAKGDVYIGMVLGGKVCIYHRYYQSFREHTDLYVLKNKYNGGSMSKVHGFPTRMREYCATLLFIRHNIALRKSTCADFDSLAAQDIGYNIPYSFVHQVIQSRQDCYLIWNTGMYLRKSLVSPRLLVG